jgi:hypothetical protein
VDKFEGIQKQLTAKIRSAGARGDGGAVPLHIVFAATGPIELWDSGRTVSLSAHAGDTLQSLAITYHVPLWTLAQINQKAENAALTEGERFVVPRYLGQRVVPSPTANSAPSPASSPAPSER